MRYVVVDDEPKIRDGLKGFLSARRDCESVRAFVTAGDAFAFLSEETADVLLTDIRMPGISGLDLIERLRRLYPDLAIIIISGYSEFDYAQKAIELGVRRYLTKPTDLEALTKTLDEIAAELTADGASGRHLPENRLLRTVVTYMENHLAEKLELAQLAEAGFVTPNYLCRRFRALIGASPMEYLTGLRMRKAAELLREPGASIEKIAEAVGYDDRRSFSRVFKRQFGLSPQAFRNKL